MPLSARSPEGVVSLVGMDLLTLERLKARNRSEKLFTARCCGAPVQIRSPAGKIAHFYHLSTTPGCQGSKGETQEHLALKERIAVAVLQAGWQVEVEAEKRGADGTLEWKADVLASRGTARVAFEVQLSNPDWTIMGERQERYRQSRVRGLWFVKTKKPYPVKRELPIFSLTTRDEAAWLVRLRHPVDWEDEWSQTWGLCNLSDFIGKSLNGALKWAPLASSPEVSCNVSARILSQGRCLGCGRDVGRAYTLQVALNGHPSFPVFNWHQGMTNRRTHWREPIIELMLKQAWSHRRTGLVDEPRSCCAACGESVSKLGRGESFGLITVPMRLGDLPKARYGTIEWDWINRWILHRD